MARFRLPRLLPCITILQHSRFLVLCTGDSCCSSRPSTYVAACLGLADSRISLLSLVSKLHIDSLHSTAGSARVRVPTRPAALRCGGGSWIPPWLKRRFLCRGSLVYSVQSSFVINPLKSYYDPRISSWPFHNNSFIRSALYVSLSKIASSVPPWALSPSINRAATRERGGGAQRAMTLFFLPCLSF